jgi:succinate dehydrogenase / fumarate reductase membrane anchor subunit
VGFSFWPWFLQRVTGAALVVLLFVHLWVNHITGIDQVEAGIYEDLVLFSLVADRLSEVIWWIVDIPLLGFTLFHGLNGIRNIALDWGVRDRGLTVLTGFVSLVGVVAFGFGIAALIAFQMYDQAAAPQPYERQGAGNLPAPLASRGRRAASTRRCPRRPGP